MFRRLSWTDYFFTLTEIVSQRSSCLRRQIGAIAVKDKRIIATGYNGAPTGIDHCIDRGGCLREQLKIKSGTQHEVCRAIHAEENLIIQAAIHGVSLHGCEIYCTHQPCILCSRKLISIQPSGIFYLHDYPDEASFNLLSEVLEYGIMLHKFNDQKIHHWGVLNAN